MKDRKIFYGYFVVGASVIIMTVAWGANRTFGVFLEPMLKEFGWTRAAISGSFTLNMLVMGGAALAAGNMTDRFGPRIVLLACGVFLGLSYILSGWVETIWEFYFSYGVIGGLGMSGILTPLMSATVKWFVRRRALMTGIIVAGPSLGIMIMPVFFTYLISSMGWRLSYLILGAIALAGIIIPAFLIRQDPQDMGLQSYGAEVASKDISPCQSLQIPLSEAFWTRQFWLVNLLAFCDLFLINVVAVHIVIHAMDLNIPPAQAASVLSLAAGIAIPGRILMGAVGDRIGNRPAMLICFAMSIVAFSILLLAKNLGLLYLFAVLYGLGLWATASLLSPLVAELFGLRFHATLYSWTVFTSCIGSAAGPVLAGALFDTRGNYRLAFFLCLVFSGIGLAATLLIRPIQEKKKSGDCLSADCPDYPDYPRS
jgi:MFS family permease